MVLNLKNFSNKLIFLSAFVLRTTVIIFSVCKFLLTRDQPTTALIKVFNDLETIFLKRLRFNRLTGLQNVWKVW